MIRHGQYLALLAKEYRLLKDAGEDVTGTGVKDFVYLAFYDRIISLYLLQGKWTIYEISNKKYAIQRLIVSGGNEDVYFKR
jgi:hypothetical protein